MKERITRVKVGDKTKGKTDWDRVRALTDEEIEAAVGRDPDAEFWTEDDWAEAELVVPKRKIIISLRLDPDLLDYFKKDGRGYQTRINAVLRRFVEVQKSKEKHIGKVEL